MIKTFTQLMSRFFLLFLLFNTGNIFTVNGQNKTYATNQSNGKNAATIVAGLISGGYSSTSFSSVATVENPQNSVNGNETTFSTMKARNLNVALVDYSGEAWLQMNYTSAVSAYKTSYVKIDEPTTSGWNIDLLATVGGLLGLLNDNIIIVEAYNNSSKLNNVESTISRDGNGNIYIAVTPSQAYTGIRVKLRSQGNLLGLSLGGGLDMKVYGTFYYESGELCSRPQQTFFKSSGINVSLLDYQDRNLEKAIDTNGNSFSTLKQTALLNVSLAGSQSQVFHFASSSNANSSLNIKFAIGSSSVLNTDLLGSSEVIFYNGNSIVYRRSLLSSLLNHTDLLNLLQNGNPVVATFAPGRLFDKVEVRLSSPVGLSVLGSTLRIYDIQRYGDNNSLCPNPEIVPTPAITFSPLDSPSCSFVLSDYSNVDFPNLAVDGNNETYATLHADAGNLLVNGPNAGFLEFDLGATAAYQTVYVRIGYDKDVLNRLLAGSLGELVTGLGNDLLLGNQYIQIQVHGNNNEILNVNSSNFFGGSNGTANGIIRIVEDKIGRYYIAITPYQNYDKIKITNHVDALLATGKQASLEVYDACFEMGQNDCLPPAFTSFSGSGLNLSVGNLSEVGVKDPYKAISDNSSEYSEINLGALALGAQVYQSVFFSDLSQAGDKVKIDVMIDPSAVLTIELLGAYQVKFYKGKNQVGSTLSFQDGLLNNLDLLSLLNAKGIIELEFESTLGFDRVDIGAITVVGLNVATPPLRIYKVEKYGNLCPLAIKNPPFDQTQFANELVSWGHADFVQNVLDTANFDSYASLRSNAGPLVGINSYSGHVEMKYQTPISAGKTSYVRIDFDEDILNALLSGSLGSVANDLINNLLLGNHYFDIELKMNGNDVLSGSSKNTPLVGNGDIRIVQDALGRYYIAITPEQQYNSVKITSHTDAALGLLAQPNSMNVYGMYSEMSNNKCLGAFATSFEYEGINLGVDPVGSAGVTNAEYALDENSQHYSEISNGTLGVGNATKQWIYFNTQSPANDIVEIRLKTEGGGVDLDVLGGLEVIAYLGNQPVDTFDFQNGIIHGVNIINLLNNNQLVKLIFQPNQDFDRLSIGIRTILNVSVFPPIHLYGIERCKDISNLILAVNDINQSPQDMTTTGNLLLNDRGSSLKVSKVFINDANGELIQSIPNNQPINVYNSQNELAGKISIQENGEYVFTPETGYTGQVSVQYEAQDEYGYNDRAELMIKILPEIQSGVNNPPVANDDHVITKKNTLITGNVLENDSDPDGDAMALTSIFVDGIEHLIDQAGIVVNTSHGDLTIRANGDFSFHPNNEFAGNVPSMEYRICDDGNPQECDHASLKISVLNIGSSENITIANDDAIVGQKGQDLQGNVLMNDFDPEGDNQTLSSISINGTEYIIPANGTEIISIPGKGVLTIGSNGEYSFVPVTNFIGTIPVEQNICDDGMPTACSQASLYITFLTPTNPLSIHNIDFVVHKENNTSVLEWTAVFKERPKGYVIERSIDANNWDSIGYLSNTQTSQFDENSNQYKFKDLSPRKGMNFYRLKVVGIDGKNQWSEVRSVYFDRFDEIFDIYPNPAQRYLFITGLDDAELIKIRNVNGKIMKEIKINHEKEYKLNLEQYASGIYFMNVYLNSGAIQTRRFIVDK